MGLMAPVITRNTSHIIVSSLYLIVKIKQYKLNHEIKMELLIQKCLKEYLVYPPKKRQNFKMELFNLSV